MKDKMKEPKRGPRSGGGDVGPGAGTPGGGAGTIDGKPDVFVV